MTLRELRKSVDLTIAKVVVMNDDNTTTEYDWYDSTRKISSDLRTELLNMKVYEINAKVGHQLVGNEIKVYPYIEVSVYMEVE